MKNKNLLNFFQSGFYEKFWRWEFNDNESQEVAEKSLKLLNIKPGHILDWCGGWGRISIYLAKKGYKITILDFVEEYLNEAKKNFNDNNLKVNTIISDCINTPQDIQADNAICSFNSIGFLSDEDQLKAFKSLNKAIKKDGKIIIDCINLLFIAKYYRPVLEKKRPDGIKCIQNNSFDLKTNTLLSDFVMIDKQDNIIASNSIKQRLYTPLELEKMLNNSNFKVLNMYGSFDADELSFSLPQIITIAQKN